MFLLNLIGRNTYPTSTTFMTKTLNFSTCYISYIKNDPYSYPTNDKITWETETKIDTGWQIIPNVLWRHFVTPKDWAQLQIEAQAYRVLSCSATVFNMIPMTTQLAIQGNTLFTSFNNCIYAWGYADKFYETSMYDYFSQQAQSQENLNLVYKEGMYRWNDATQQTYWHQHLLPKYRWSVPHVRTSTDETWFNNSINGGGEGVYPTTGKPTGVYWDPLNRPGDLMELRPGKNAITYKWTVHDCDKHLWYNMDGIASWYPYTATGPYNASGNPRPGSHKISTQMDPDRISTRYQTGNFTASKAFTNDYTLQNLMNQPLVPCNWWWHEMRNSIIQEHGGTSNNVVDTLKPDLWFPGTEKECAHYPPDQWFIKLIPLISSNNLIETYAQVAIKMELSVEIKPRQSAIYAPTWGPFSWTDLYCANPTFLNFHPSMIRYRTGGMRRTWQNIKGATTTGDTPSTQATGHYREDPYLTATVPAGSGAGSTYTVTDSVPRAKPEYRVTFTKNLERTEIQEIPSRTVTIKRLAERQRDEEMT
nr:capsid protein VP1 [Bird parvovirus]